MSVSRVAVRPRRPRLQGTVYVSPCDRLRSPTTSARLHGLAQRLCRGRLHCVAQDAPSDAPSSPAFTPAPRRPRTSPRNQP